MDDRPARVFVLTPEGEVLRVCTSPRPMDLQAQWVAMCHFDGKLVVGDRFHGELLGLQGL